MNDTVERKNVECRESVIPEVRYKSDLPVSRRAFNKFVARIYDVYAGNIDMARLMVLVLEAYLLGDMVMAMALLERHGDRNVFKFLRQEVDVAIKRSRRAKELARIRAYSSIPEYVPTREPEVREIEIRGPKVKDFETRGPKRLTNVQPVKTKGLQRGVEESMILTDEPKVPHSIEMLRRHLQNTKCAGIRIRQAVSAVSGGYKVMKGDSKVMRKEDYTCGMNNPPIEKSFINLFNLITS